MCEQNTNLKAEVNQLKSSKTQLSSELGKLKDKYQSLSEDFEKSTFINEAGRLMKQLEGILIETKSMLPILKKHKVHILTYCMYSIGYCECS